MFLLYCLCFRFRRYCSGEWQQVEFDDKEIFDMDLEGFGGMQILTDYSMAMDGVAPVEVNGKSVATAAAQGPVEAELSEGGILVLT